MRSLFALVVVCVAGACAPEDKMNGRANAGQADASLERSAGAVVMAPAPSSTTPRTIPEFAGSPAPAPASGGSYAVVFVGTSLTAGYGLTPEAAYPARVAALAAREGIKLRVVNAGVSGETSAGAVRRIDWIVRNRAHVFLIETGANDGLRGLDVDSTRENIVRIVERLKAAHPRARVLLVQMEAPPNYGIAYVRRFRGMYGEAARETGATLIPFMLDGVAGVPELNQADGIHPNAAGSLRVAANVWGPLKRALREIPAGQ